MSRRTKLFFRTLGCPKNRVDTELMLGALLREGGRAYELVAEPGDADVLVVNTCSFIEPSKVESIDAIMELVEAKAEAGGTKRVVVAGCFAQRYPQAIAEEIPEVDLVIGTGEYHRIAALLDAEPPAAGPLTAVGQPCYVHDSAAPRLLTTPRWSAWLKIAEGCSQHCSFCVIPAIRGRQRSRPIPDVVSEARSLVESGAVELNLVAQDLTHYGSDLGDGTELAGLLRALGRVDGLRWIRLLYGYPHNVTDELVEVIATSEKVLPYIDIPIQHIDDALLRAMQRRTTSAGIRDTVRRLRSAVPDIVIRTTFIVGFPGETEEAFERLVELAAEERFERVGVFAYSHEEGTRAARLADDVPTEVKEKRLDRLMTLQQEVSREKLQALVGREVDVLVEGPSPETDLLLAGRYSGQAPDVDGVTYINEGFAEPGSIIRGEVVMAGDYDLVVRALGRAGEDR